MEVFLGIVTMLIAIFCVFLLCPPQTDALAPPPPPTAAAPPPAQPAVAGALVVFQWPMAYCKLNDGCGKDIPDDRFLLHGVWPIDGQGVSIKNCGVPYSNTAAYSVPNLGLYWRGLNQRNKDFWKYEWDTHGSCSGQTVKDYFINSRDLCKQYYIQLYKKLVEEGIRPSSNTNMNIRSVPYAQDYYDAIYNQLNVVPIIVCKTSEEGAIYLLEIRLCASADLLRFQNCARGNNIRNCGDKATGKALFYTSSHRVRALDYLSSLSVYQSMQRVKKMHDHNIVVI